METGRNESFSMCPIASICMYILFSFCHCTISMLVLSKYVHNHLLIIACAHLYQAYCSSFFVVNVNLLIINSLCFRLSL